MSNGDATAILMAIMRGDDYPPAGVADTPESRRVWDGTKRDVENKPLGAVVDVPFDWAE
jgi:hypothetical protein